MRNYVEGIGIFLKVHSIRAKTIRDVGKGIWVRNVGFRFQNIKVSDLLVKEDVLVLKKIPPVVKIGNDRLINSRIDILVEAVWRIGLDTVIEAKNSFICIRLGNSKGTKRLWSFLAILFRLNIGIRVQARKVGIWVGYVTILGNASDIVWGSVFRVDVPKVVTVIVEDDIHKSNKL